MILASVNLLLAVINPIHMESGFRVYNCFLNENKFHTSSINTFHFSNFLAAYEQSVELPPPPLKWVW